MQTGKDRDVIALAFGMLDLPNLTQQDLEQLSVLGRRLIEPVIAVGALTRLHERDPRNLATIFELVDAEEFFCLKVEASKHLDLAEPLCRTAQDFACLGDGYNKLDNVEEAITALKRAVELDPDALDYWFDLAVYYGFLGKTDAAEEIYDTLIAKNVKRNFAFQNRSWSRRQTSARNHVEELRKAISALPDGPNSEPRILYALGKELEDLGEVQESFEWYAAAAAEHRRTLADYDIERELLRLNEQVRNFTADFLAMPREGHSSSEPIFVVSMPRAGSTLVEQILGRHSAVFAAGEMESFQRLSNFAAIRVAREAEEIKPFIPSWYARLPFKEIGESYVQSTRPRTGHTLHFVDKRPLNFIFSGVIACALPNAKIVHVHRDPMDACFAMYKHFLLEGYAFTYDQRELGQYYVAYRHLMDHWDKVMPGRIIHVAYEELISESERVTRDLIKRMELPWEDACLDNSSGVHVSKTASASQVRQPLYKSSIGKWRAVADQLTPLMDTLEAGGIGIDRP